LRTAVIYGPNASGKSALVFAMQFAQTLVRQSAINPPDSPVYYTPFKLDENTASEPTEFEFTFILNGVRYQYGFSFNQDGFEEEWLLVYKAPKPQLWFERKYDENQQNDVYKFGASLVGSRKVWEAATRRNSLFLSMAVQLNSESLRPVFQWITQSLLIFNSGMQPFNAQSIAWAGHPAQKELILDFLNAADIGISDVKIDKRKMPHFEFGIKAGEIPKPVQMQREFDVPIFIHENKQTRAIFEIQDESTGTQRLFAFAAPLIEALREKRTVVVDELDGSLHSYLVRYLVELFQRPTSERSNAQLIFTTHDTSLLDFKILRRDQVWFMEKTLDHASTLTPLTDFSPRKDEALERGYLQGRYGALPLVSDFDPAGDESGAR